MGKVAVQITLPGRASDAERLWYDTARWPAWVDGLAHVDKVEGDWPQTGARVVWDSRPGGRGRVWERVVAYEPRTGQTVEVEDEKMRGTQRLEITPSGTDEVKVRCSLEYQLKSASPLTAISDVFFIRRAMRDSLRRTLGRFARELEAELAEA